MSNFIVELWEGIFTPGPTPTLLKAANASFAALQLVLLLLLVATYNIHCLILSVICAGLWASINWFAAELAVVQREQAQREEAEKKKKKKKEEEEEDGGSTTEVETVAKEDEAKSSVVDTLDVKGDVTRRGGPQAQTQAQTQTQSSASTEDEWEKVSEAENEKDK